MIQASSPLRAKPTGKQKINPCQRSKPPFEVAFQPLSMLSNFNLQRALLDIQQDSLQLANETDFSGLSDISVERHIDRNPSLTQPERNAEFLGVLDALEDDPIKQITSNGIFESIASFIKYGYSSSYLHIVSRTADPFPDYRAG